jgi:alpha-L-rhamnosidase
MCRDAAQRLGEHADAECFAAEYAAIAADFTKEFVDADGRVVGRSKPIESQTGYVLALHFDLLPENLRAKAAAHLVADITARDGHLSTGFVGLPYLLPVLSRFGHSDIAFALLTKRSYPSWGYEIAHGATTIWERWNGYHHEKGPGDPNMNSYSHYAYGAVGEWLFSDVLGIEALSDGFATVRIRPRVGGELTQASGSFHSLRGEIRSSWHIADGRFHLDVQIPGNVSAEIHLPTPDPKALTCLENCEAAQVSDDMGYARVVVGAGTWHFQCPWNA